MTSDILEKAVVELIASAGSWPIPASIVEETFPDFSVELATIADSGKALVVLAQMEAEEIENRSKVDIDLTLWRRLQEAGQLAVVVLRVGGILSGALVFRLFRAPQGYAAAEEQMFFVMKEHRRAASAVAMILYAETALRAAGISRVMVGAMIKHDIGPFYRMLGYEAICTTYGKELAP